ncbi:MAG: hypothetical protein B7X04_04190 [Parcubacteria group bacterium 21-54-25]|nr:MAG: hypothetical protein B7X04_04190 [Parcubacteria group bacterium 21-54-25]HQU08235.1 VIT1/CCC1 family protein [Candidatus Paceibacterota bacterium]
MLTVSEAQRREFLDFERNEFTEHRVYARLALAAKHPHNRAVLTHLADMEHAHALFWKRYTGEDVRPHAFAIFWYPFLAKLFGLTFAIKLLERSITYEETRYRALVAEFPDIAPILEDEETRENEIIEMLHDPFLINASSIVLGLNDALVELTGAMAGFTFALGRTDVIAAAGLITGLSASLSMAASEYLSTKSEESNRNPFAAAAFTGAAYLAVVLLFIAPYLFIANPYIALGILGIEAFIIIALFSFYRSIARGLSFVKQFLEMALISLSVALLTFLVAVAVRLWLGA